MGVCSEVKKTGSVYRFPGGGGQPQIADKQQLRGRTLARINPDAPFVR